jgi:hypothetical protein
LQDVQDTDKVAIVQAIVTKGQEGSPAFCDNKLVGVFSG